MRFERLENEKLNVVRQVVTQEDSLDKCQEELRALKEETGNSKEVLGALREAKRAVETKLKNVLQDNAGMSVQVSFEIQ